MRKYILLSLILFICFQSSAQITWYRNYELAKEVARSEGKLLMIDFWAVWCGPCRDMDVKLWGSDEMVNLSENFVAYKMDVDVETSLASKYRVKGIPRVAFITPDEEIIWDKTGFSTSSDYLKAFEHIPSNLHELFEAIAKLGEEENQEDLFRLGEAYSAVAKTIEYSPIANDFFRLSNSYFRKAEKGENEIIAQLAELSQILNIALDGNSKRALKKLEKADNPESEITKEFISYVRAYCYKCEGLDKEFEKERAQLKDKKLIAELDKDN